MEGRNWKNAQIKSLKNDSIIKRFFKSLRTFRKPKQLGLKLSSKNWDTFWRKPAQKRPFLALMWLNEVIKVVLISCWFILYEAIYVFGCNLAQAFFKILIGTRSAAFDSFNDWICWSLILWTLWPKLQWPKCKILYSKKCNSNSMVRLSVGRPNFDRINFWRLNFKVPTSSLHWTGYQWRPQRAQ